MDWAGFHQGFQVEYFTLLLGSKFYLLVSKGYDMKSTEEKGSKIIVNFGNVGGGSLTNQLKNVFESVLWDLCYIVNDWELQKYSIISFSLCN